jgi:hypothetical protein
MTEHNHRRGTKGAMFVYGGCKRHNGFGLTANAHRATPDKSMQNWMAVSILSDSVIGAGIGNDFTKGNRGMAKSARGAKKFVRSRVRFHENAATRQLARLAADDIGAEA